MPTAAFFSAGWFLESAWNVLTHFPAISGDVTSLQTIVVKSFYSQSDGEWLDLIEIRTGLPCKLIAKPKQHRLKNGVANRSSRAITVVSISVSGIGLYPEVLMHSRHC